MQFKQNEFITSIKLGGGVIEAQTVEWSRDDASGA